MKMSFKEKNKRFIKANKSRRRVMIARDVLSQLGIRLIAKQLVWVDGIDFSGKVCQVNSITKKNKKCNVCGLGALFVAAVESANDLKNNDLVLWNANRTNITSTDIFNYLGRFFDKSQLQLIENAFELGCGSVYGFGPSSGMRFFLSGDFCIDGYFDSPENRMRLIMENIVANKGTFRPDIKPVCVNGEYKTPGFRKYNG